MNEEIKIQWLEALESGEYKQGKRQLRTDENKYCCLGVLCDIAVKQGVAQWQKREGNPGWAISPIDGASDSDGFGLLPQFIQNWAGIDSDDGTVEINENYKVSLTEYNDVREYNFSKIAKVIKDKL